MEFTHEFTTEQRREETYASNNFKQRKPIVEQQMKIDVAALQNKVHEFDLFKDLSVQSV